MFNTRALNLTRDLLDDVGVIVAAFLAGYAYNEWVILAEDSIMEYSHVLVAAIITGMVVFAGTWCLVHGGSKD